MDHAKTYLCESDDDSDMNDDDDDDEDIERCLFLIFLLKFYDNIGHVIWNS